MDLVNLIANALDKPKDAIFYELSTSLRAAFPKFALLENEDNFFRADLFAHESHCSMKERLEARSQFEYQYSPDQDQDFREIYNSWFEVQWQSESFELVTIGIEGQHCRSLRHYLLGPDIQVLRAFFRAVCKWNSEVRGEVLVFNGNWHKDKRLYESIQSSTLDSLVLEGNLKNEIFEDFQGFFDAKATYDRYGIAWKRGALLLGPPGNGKTHAVKGLANALKKPVLYVQSFKNQYQTDHSCISQVFKRARESAPCMLVLEDLDSLLDNSNRSFFLNEMDGFASNAGILTIATTNHPERLDPAILERPSRFDRKYTFNLPSTESRFDYLDACNERLEPSLRIGRPELEQVASLTDEFSFAYLKELVIGAMMTWIARPHEKSLADLMVAQVDSLREQMRTAPPVPLDSDGDDELHFPPSVARYMSRWRKR